MTKTLVQIWEHLKWISERSSRWSPESAAQMLTWHHGHESRLSVWALWVSSSWCQQLSGRDSLIEHRNHSIWLYRGLCRSFWCTALCSSAPWVRICFHIILLLLFPFTTRLTVWESGPLAHIPGGGPWMKLPLRRDQDSSVVSLPPPVRRCRCDVFRCLGCLVAGWRRSHDRERKA